MIVQQNHDQTFGPQFPGRFDFTLRFEEWIMTILPSIFIILSTPFYIRRILVDIPAVRAGTLLRFKMVVVSALTISQVTNAVFWGISERYRSNVGIASAALACVGALCTAFIVYTDHFHSIQPSSFISIYLSCVLPLDIAKTRSYFLRGDLSTIANIAVLISVLKFALILLEETSKRRLINKAEDDITEEAFSGFWNRALFIWLNSTFIGGFTRILNVCDLQSLPPEFRVEHASIKFREEWNNTSGGSVFDLFTACIKALGPTAYFVIVPRLFYLAVSYSQPFLVNRVILAAAADSVIPTSSINGLISAGIIVFSLMPVSRNYYQHLINRQTTLVRVYLLSAIYHKIFELEYSDVKKSAALSLMSTDLDGMGLGVTHIHELWSSLIAVGAGVYVLSIFVGPGCVFSLIPICATTYLSVKLSARMRPAQKIWNEHIERRVATTSDTLQQMKSIKMSGLADVMANFLQGMLQLEIAASFKLRKLLSLSYGIASAADQLTPMAVFAAGLFWTRSSNGFTVADIYASLAIVSLISQPLMFLVTAATKLSSALACFQRIHAFLTLGELVDNREYLLSVDQEQQVLALPTNAESQQKSHCSIKIINVSTQPTEDGRQILCNVSFHCEAHQVTMIIGSVGSGKTTLLKALLGETGLSGGSIVVDKSKICYCDQTAWIRNISIRYNILGEEIYCESWYKTVIFVCNLIDDINRLIDGENTLAGTGGCNLSGGQKQRVALARALYSRRPILVLDDIFSGLDKKTASIIFHRLFGPNGVLREAGTTVVLATNLVEYLGYADQIISIEENGQARKIEGDELIQKGYLLTDSDEINTSDNDISDGKMNMHITERESETTGSRETEQSDRSRQRGDVQLYWYYIRTFGIGKLTFWLLWTALSATIERLPNVFIRIWFSIDPENNVYFTGYALIGFVSFLNLNAWTLFYFLFLISSSYEKLHWTLLSKVMNATWAFLSSTDSGLLLNRFSQDMSLMSQSLPFNFMQLTFTFFTVITGLAIVSSTTKFAALIAPIFISLMYFLLKYYLRTSRQLRHLELEAKSPLFTLFTETSNGMQHIRAFQWRQQFESRAMELMNLAQIPFYNMLCTQQWLRLVLDLVIMAIAVSLIALALYLRTSGAGIGLGLVSLIWFSNSLAYHLNKWVDLETSLGVIARLRTFEEQTPSEIDESVTLESPENLTSWPRAGEVEFRDLSATYSNADSRAVKALTGITFSVKHGQKVGICGRTGSGKSSILLSILNFLQYSGSLLVDGIEVRKIPHGLLRSRITTIPQDAVEIPGSVRMNLSPWATSSTETSELRSDIIDQPTSNNLTSTDSTMIDVLTRLGIWNHIELLGGLDANLQELDLSQGQRQLMGIARAMIHHLQTNSKIVLMDEVTSHLDYDTDRQVQAVLREAFADTTMFVIAHRQEILNQLDAIVEIADGRLVLNTTRNPLD